jgi:uncharacterized protein YdeI (YjbR/CyaY-like superfamily)
MKKLQFTNRNEWRDWLKENHHQEQEIWLVYYKKKTGKKSIPYGASVEEALCFGWIDSIIKKIDDSRYARKFTPRTENSNWSALNINRAERMIQAGLMTEHGLRLVEAAKAAGKWEKPVQKPVLSYQIHPDFEKALRSSKIARENFDDLAPSYQKQYIGWIQTAKRETTRQRRIAESIRLLEQGQKLGLK